MNSESPVKNGNLWLNLLVVGMTLGTAWAIRGQFGHEQGAAWAGAIGGMIIIVIANREDWHSNLITSTLASAIGWGLGGMISYGVVVGYARALDFVNVYYGLTMLFLIGGLYGFLGGGLFGLSLEPKNEKKVNWGTVIVAMTTGAIIMYFFVIMQLGWLMTPPRSEAWAGCLGMVLGLSWYLYTYQFFRPIHVALCSSIGGGIGFALGNFLQVIGIVSKIDFNFWNVMEYSIGFFGGLGMAYGVFTARWEKDAGKLQETRILPLLALVGIIPFVVWFESMTPTRVNETYSKINEINQFGTIIQWISLFIILAFAYYSLRNRMKLGSSINNLRFFLVFFGIYMVFSWLITGAWLSTYRIEQYLYPLNLLLIWLLIPKLKPVFKSSDIKSSQWLQLFVMVLLVIAVLALVALYSHGPWEHYQERFKQ